MKSVKDRIEKYTYSVTWYQPDECFVGTCAEFPLLSGMADSREEALKEIYFVVEESVKWMLEDGEDVPEPPGSNKAPQGGVLGGESPPRGVRVTSGADISVPVKEGERRGGDSTSLVQ